MSQPNRFCFYSHNNDEVRSVSDHGGLVTTGPEPSSTLAFFFLLLKDRRFLGCFLVFANSSPVSPLPSDGVLLVTENTRDAW